MMQTTQDWEGEKLAPFVIWWNWHHVGFGNENLDPTRMCNPSEARPKLAIVLPKMVFRPLSIRRGFPKLLCGPSKGTK